MYRLGNKDKKKTEKKINNTGLPYQIKFLILTVWKALYLLLVFLILSIQNYFASVVIMLSAEIIIFVCIANPSVYSNIWKKSIYF